MSQPGSLRDNIFNAQFSPMKKPPAPPSFPVGLMPPSGEPGSMIAPTNSGFVQVSKIYIDEMNQLAHYAPSAHRVLWTLIKEMDKQNAVMLSVDSLCRLTKLGPATIKRAVALLREQQWMDVYKIGTSNVYRVNSALVWQARADGKWASFNARIVLNFEEQDATTKKLNGAATRHIPFVQKDDANEAGCQENPAIPRDLLGDELPPE
jgi:hypothetical protein